MSDRFAAMLKLSRFTRVEHVVVYYCRVWDELEDLIRNPVAYLAVQEQRWDQDLGKLIPWAFKDGRNVHATISRASKTSLASQPYLPFVMSALQASSDKAAAEVDVFSAAAGSFLVEFAVETSYMRVITFAPASPGPPRHLGGALVKPSLAIAQGRDPAFATLHFDLPFNDPLTRARFVFNMASDANWLATELNSMFSGSVMEEAKVNLVAGSLPGSSRAKLPPTDFGPPNPPHENARTFQAAGSDSAPPDLVVQGLSDASQAPVCAVTQCSTSPSGGEVLMFGTTVHNYPQRALLDPESVVEEVLRTHNLLQ